MKSLVMVAWAGLVALNALISAGVAEATDSGPSPDPVVVFSGPLAEGDLDLFDYASSPEVGSPSDVFSLSKAAMTPSGNPLLTVAPKKLTWSRKGAGVTRYALSLRRLNKTTSEYANESACRDEIPQPASGNPVWKLPVHALITGGQYCWTVTPYAGSTPRKALIAFFRLKNEKNAYMVIDLAGGPDALGYSVSYLNAIPSEGWTDWTEEYKTTKLVLRKIPAGSFTMGSPANELGRRDDETQHPVTLTKSFYMGVFEVTQRQWELVMGTRPSYFNNSGYYATRPVEQVSYNDIREDPANSSISPNWPQSSQVHMNSFMGKLRAKTGLSTLDLPTEAQWEYACRAGSPKALNSRHNLTNTTSDASMDAVGRYLFNGGSAASQGCTPSAGTATVGHYQSFFMPNAWGLEDMHGNVMEWCLDWYGPYLVTVSNPKGPTSGIHRTFRGGSWHANADYCRSAERLYNTPATRVNSLGFRVAMTLP
jgi:formylglycine-generating enzyme required for sulfatase activity